MAFRGAVHAAPGEATTLHRRRTRRAANRRWQRTHVEPRNARVTVGRGARSRCWTATVQDMDAFSSAGRPPPKPTTIPATFATTEDTVRTETITAAPTRLSPEMRYASLHRTIENGMDTDRTWLELVQICIELERRDEARAAFEHVHEPSLRRRAFNVLAAAGVKVAMPSGDGNHPSQAKDTRHSLIEWIADGFRYLFLDHMPLTTVVATVTFPLVVGLGGFLTSSVHNSWLLPLVALIPALSVVGLIGALGRRILVDTSRGIDDVPEVPPAAQLCREAGRFLCDAVLLASLFLGPALLMTQLADVGLSAIGAAFAVGGTLLPMSLAMRQTRDDWSCLSPTDLFSSIRHAGMRYFVAVGVGFVLTTPAALSVWLTWGSALYLMVSVVGPLLVVPIFVMSRLFGQTIVRIERDRIAQQRQLATAQAVVTQAAPVAAPAPVAPRATPRAVAHPEAALAAPQAPAPRAAAPAPAPAPAVPEARAARPNAGNFPGGSLGLRSDRAVAPSGRSRSATPAEPNPAPNGIRNLGTAPAPAPARPPAPPVARSMPTPRLRARADGAQPSPQTPRPQRFQPVSTSTIGEQIPDLTKLPGVSVLKGEARVAAGAAAPTRPQS